jgi:hypothetical protein
VLAVGATTLASGAGITVLGAALTLVCMILPPLGLVVGIAWIACLAALPAFAGAGVAYSLGAEGRRVRDGALVGALSGLGAAALVGMGSVLVGLVGMIALLVVAGQRNTAGNGLGFVAVPIFGFAASAALVAISAPVFMTIGATIGASTGASREVMADPLAE